MIESCYFLSPAFERLYCIAVHSCASFASSPLLFPRLKAILCASCSRDQVALFHWLNGPSLIRLDILLVVDPTAEPLVEFVSSMDTLYPGMRSISLRVSYHSHPPDAMIRSISKTIRSWKHLVRVCLNTTELDTAVYEHLMRLETLTHLTFEMTFVNDLPPHLSQAVLPRNPFPKLKDLTLDAYHPPLIVEWLNYFHFECLSSLSCTFGSIPPLLASQIADLINAITTQPCHKSLEKVDIMLNHDIMNVEIGLIRPLFSFTHLRYVDIFRICVLALSDDDLYDLAASWPLLENLSLNVSNVADSLPTFKGFFHLLRRCPHLEQLYINIDMRDM